MKNLFVAEKLSRVTLVRCSEGQVQAALRELPFECSFAGASNVSQVDRSAEVSTEFTFTPDGVTVADQHPLYQYVSTLKTKVDGVPVVNMTSDARALGCWRHCDSIALRKFAGHCDGRVVSTVSCLMIFDGVIMCGSMRCCSP